MVAAIVSCSDILSKSFAPNESLLGLNALDELVSILKLVI